MACVDQMSWPWNQFTKQVGRLPPEILSETKRTHPEKKTRNRRRRESAELCGETDGSV